MQIIRWMCDVSMKDRRTSEELIMVFGVQPITTVIRSGRLFTRQYVLICDKNLPAKYIFMKNVNIYIYIYICVCVCVYFI